MSAGQAVFLVGGRGSRLGDLTLDTPKPLLLVAGRPFIEHLLDKAVREGFDDLVLLAGYRHEAVEAYAGAWRGVPVRLSIEPEPLDTAGAVAHAASLLREDFLLVNGDTWFDFEWSGLRLSHGLSGMIAARQVSPADRYETLDIVEGRVAAIRPRGNLASGVINGGVYRLKRDAFADVRGRASLEKDILPMLCGKELLGAELKSGTFIDIGLPDSLRAAEVMSGLRN
ncbi:D-glycero-alpha-D-manno-heptose 1-phosphate guanylyltransferase [Brevundimonas sp. SH203]|uniref:sugar phosphate nucleotidyltransferase n=1 Tax=Brevundimonas sp. SH203 TaxID=345167 RepID=UPI0009CEC9B5|nr:sugar phosphate nucleotidyltransferase [Brevundimonas sp. SH203]GAW39845.1 D-glycero-alpha-D-manno-heptose 1-phosphate guanylyltransferase [Brevundimonas sp. SH203]